MAAPDPKEPPGAPGKYVAKSAPPIGGHGSLHSKRRAGLTILE